MGMRLIRSWFLVATCVATVSLYPPVVGAQEVAEVDFDGRWSTDYGVVVLAQDGDQVTGSYTYGLGGAIAGQVEGRRLTFRYIEPMAWGDAYFEMSPDNSSFTGQWLADGTEVWLPWNGRRLEPQVVVEEVAGGNGAFIGLFETNWGRLRLSPGLDHDVSGHYSGGTLSGSVAGNRLEYTYREATGTTGSGWFEPTPEGGIRGDWSSSEGGSGSWSGSRVDIEPGVVWLVVLEAQWETSLAESEYSFGDMLRTYFERMPNVRVRHRRIADLADYRRAASELAFLAEPTALWLSGHGAAGRLALEGGGVGAPEILETLQRAENVFLVHFSSCEMMVDGVAETIRAGLPTSRELAISGYEVPVDWGGSAVLEILYLDLVLGRGMPPRAAASVLLNELNFADESGTSGSPLGALHFRID